MGTPAAHSWAQELRDEGVQTHRASADDPAGLASRGPGEPLGGPLGCFSERTWNCLLGFLGFMVYELEVFCCFVLLKWSSTCWVEEVVETKGRHRHPGCLRSDGDRNTKTASWHFHCWPQGSRWQPAPACALTPSPLPPQPPVLTLLRAWRHPVTLG